MSRTTSSTTPVAPVAAPELPADLAAGLRRLKLAAVRRIAPEVLITARTQRWTPEEVLRTLIEAEITARDASNAAARLKAATFPVLKTIDGFDVAASSIPQATFDYLTGLEWLRSKANLALVGPPGTGKSHCETSCSAGRQYRCCAASGWADSSFTRWPPLGCVFLDWSAVHSESPAPSPVLSSARPVTGEVVWWLAGFGVGSAADSKVTLAA